MWNHSCWSGATWNTSRNMNMMLYVNGKMENGRKVTCKTIQQKFSKPRTPLWTADDSSGRFSSEANLIFEFPRASSPDLFCWLGLGLDALRQNLVEKSGGNRWDGGYGGLSGHTHSILFLRSHCIGWRSKHLKMWLWNPEVRWSLSKVSAVVWTQSWRLLVAAINPPKTKLSQMTFLIWFVAEPQLCLAALPDGRTVSDVHADWNFVTKGGFMPRRHRVSLRHATTLFIDVVWSGLLRLLFLSRVMVVEERPSQDLWWSMFKPGPGLKKQVHVSRAHVLAFLYTNAHLWACVRHRPSDWTDLKQQQKSVARSVYASVQVQLLSPPSCPAAARDVITIFRSQCDIISQSEESLDFIILVHQKLSL